MADTFRGDNAHLCECIDALLSLDASGSMAPHGVGGHARALLESASARLRALSPAVAQIACDCIASRCLHEKTCASFAASPQQEPGAVPSDDELTGMWERADLIGGATDCVTPADESGAVGRAFTEEVGRDDKPTGYFLFESAPSGQTPTGADRDGLPECIWIPAVVLIAYSSEPDPRDAPRVKYRLANLSTATSAGTTGDDSEDAARDGYYLASFKHKSQQGVLWWMPNNSGYTPDLAQAGIYATPQPGYHDSDDTIPVPVWFVDGLRVRRVVDAGDSLNGAFHTRDGLRAAIDDARRAREVGNG